MVAAPRLSPPRPSSLVALPRPTVANTGPSIKLASITQRLHVAAVPSNPVDPVDPVKNSSEPTGHSSLVTRHSNAGGVDPAYTYDLNGNRSSMITPFGAWTYTYDILDRLITITNPNSEVTSFAYDSLDRRASVTYANGVVTSYTYNANSWLTGMMTEKGGVTISSYSYTYDEVGNRLSMTDNSGTHNYAYDLQYRLVSATHPQPTNPNETFTYDSVGNRLSSHKSANYVYDNLNRLLEDDQLTYTYDNNGNLISKSGKISGGSTTYQYDGENRLVQVTTPTDVVQYRYDGFGRRIGKTVNGVVTSYVYDREDILFEVDVAGVIRAKYTHGPGIDEPISVERDTNGDGTLDTTYYFQYDGLGSVTSLSDALGNIAQTYEYDSFGKIVSQTGNVENFYTFTAREWDEKAGLYFYRARYYDAEVGRFITADPIMFAGGINFYAYSNNSPFNFSDPTGKGPVSVGICIALAAYDVYVTKRLTSQLSDEILEINKKINELEKSCPLSDKDQIKQMEEIEQLKRKGLNKINERVRVYARGAAMGIPIGIFCRIAPSPVFP